MPWDYHHQFSLDHAILLAASEVCNKHIIEFADDAERNEFFKPHVIKMVVKVAFTGMANGMRLQARYASAVNLTSDAVVIAQTGILLPANLTIGKIVQLTVPPRRVVAGLDFFGVYYELINAVATAGTVNTFLDEGPEEAPTHDTAL